MIDLHIHILPGIDDGAASTADALQMASIAAAEGFTAVVATPHVISGLYDNTRQQILEAVDRFNRRLAAENISLQVLPGAEYRLEPDLPGRLGAGRLLTINDGGRYLLVELPTSLVPGYAEQLLYEIQLQGVTPVIAHPERNPELNRHPEKLARLAGRGVLAQVTAGSISGRFGQTAKRAALKMMERGAVQVVATDAHSPRRRTPAIAAVAREIEARFGKDFTRAVLAVHPRQIVAGETVEPALEEPRQGFLARVFRQFSR